MDGLLDYATLASALACGLTAGAFLAFSSFVMGALARLAPAEGIRAMQSINVVVINPVFMTVLFGPALAGVALGVWAVASWDEPQAPWILAGAAVYLVGTAGVTIAANVPRNDALERLDADAPDAPLAWRAYVREWTAWNTVRTVAALAAAGLLTVAIAAG